MDIDAVILDLESQFDARLKIDSDVVKAELLEAERASILLAERLSSVRGQVVDLFLVNGSVVTVSVLRVGSDWVLGNNGNWDYLVPASSLVAVSQLGRAHRPLTPIEGRVTFSSLIREMVRRRAKVRWISQRGEWLGEMIVAGGDWVDFMVEEQRKMLTLRKDALVAVSAPVSRHG